MGHPPFIPYRRALKGRPNPFAAIPRRRSENCGSSSCASRLLVIEVDGDSHYHPHGASYDASRTAALQAQGTRVIRFSNLDGMEQFESVCEGITQALEKS